MTISLADVAGLSCKSDIFTVNVKCKQCVTFEG